MLKYLVISIFILPLNTSGQNNYLGEWYDYWGSSFNIKSDSTFKFTWRFDLIENWSKGVWVIKNDTIYFRIVPVYDTIKYSSGYSLVLATDEEPRVIIPKIIVEMSSRTQDSSEMPVKLYYHKDRLYTVDKNGKPVKKKVKAWNGRWPPWYVRPGKIFK